MKCTKCNKEIDNDSKFCIHCGELQNLKIHYTKKDLEPFSENNKWGFKDRDTRDIIVRPIYSSINKFVNGIAIVSIGNKYGMVDENGDQITQIKYQSIEQYVNGFAIVKFNDKFSFINKEGNEVAPFKYDTVFNFINDYARVICDNRYSFLNKEGNEIVPFHYLQSQDFYKGFAMVCNEKQKYGFINELGIEIIKCEYSSILSSENEEVIVVQNHEGNIGIYNYKAKLILPVEHRDKNIKIFANGEIFVNEYDQWYCYDTDGHDISEKSEALKSYVIKKRRKKIIAILGFSLILIIAVLCYFLIFFERNTLNDPTLTDEQIKWLNNYGIEMIYVKGGTFQMGWTNKSTPFYDDVLPVHNVILNDYYIGKYEVTQETWERIMGDNPSKNIGSKRLPVDNVSWKDVMLFIKRLNEQTGLNFRLPTEAEWEYAARGGIYSKGFIFSGGNFIEEVGWVDGLNRSKINCTTHIVGQKLGNELDIYDMTGNVSEWCSDWYDENFYSNKEKRMNNPKGPKWGSKRVQRGGSVDYFDLFMFQVAFRGWSNPKSRSPWYGFRIAHN